MKIIVGIGNPGRTFAATRHNVGFMVLDKFAADHHVGPWRRRFHSRAAEGVVAGEKVLLMKPQTFVNVSGRAARAAAEWSRVRREDMMVVCDDFNLRLGRLRVRAGGSSGGHHGLDSISAHLNTSQVARLRIGIGAEGAERGRDFVLSRFLPAEQDAVNAAVQRAVKALTVWLKSGIGPCQNEFNTDPDATPGKKREEADA